jgi:TP901 family phage tail tape measure protein
MSDNNLDIRARLTGEDRLSPTVVKLMAKIKSLEDQMKRFGDKARASITDIPMEGYVKKLTKAGTELNGLTKKHMEWAKANGVGNKDAALSWGKLTNEIIRLKGEHEKFTNSSAKGAKTRAANAEKELKLQYKNAVAFKYLYNKVGDQRLDIARRVTEQEGNLEAAHLRNQERRHQRYLGNVAKMRRDAMRSFGMMSNIGSRAGPYAAATAAATGYAGVSAFKARMKVDTAETNMRMFAEMSQDQVKDLRKNWGNKAAIRYGMGPAETLDAYTETRKAGIPEKYAQSVTDTIMKAGAGLDLDLKETTRFATRLATLTQDMTNLDPAKLKSMLNSVAIAGIATAADPNEIIAANRRASGAFSSSKMSPNDLSAFTGAGISAGLPSSKTGTFIGFLVNELVGGKFARGQRAQDLGKASNMLGLGGRQAMSSKMASNPTETLLQIFEKMGGMSEEKRSQVATLLGMREWRDELQTFVQVRDDVRRTLTEIQDPKNANRLDDISDSKLKSLSGRWKSLVAALTIVWESVGAGFEKAFGQITDFFTDYLGRLDTKKISDTVEAFTDGLVEGLGFNNWTEMLKAAFGDPSTVKGAAKEVGGFTKGFMTSMKDMWTTFKMIWEGMMKVAGVVPGDPESIGRFTGKMVELAVAMKAIGTLADSLAGIVTFVKGLVSAVMVAPEFFAAISGGTLGAYLGKKAREYVDGGGSAPERKPGERHMGSTPPSMQKRIDDYTLKQLYHPSNYTGATDFSGRRRTGDLSDSLNKFTGKVELAAFRNGSGGLQYAAVGGGSGRGLSSSGGGGFSGGLLGGVPSLLKSTPGSALPDFGVGRSGSIIGRDKVGALTGANKSPSFGASPGGVADMSVGQGLAGNAFLAARRAKFAEEIKNDPTLAMHLAAMQATEGASKGGTIESLMNRADMQGKSLRQMLGYSADGVSSTDSRGRQNSFYGPIRRQELPAAIRRLQNNPKEFAKYNALTQRALAGGHVIGGYTDQGLPTDPNGSARTGIAGFKISPKDGNEFTDWVGPGSKFGRGRNGAMNYRKFIEQGIAGSNSSPIGNVPTPSQSIQNVPLPSSGAGAGAGDVRSSSGPVAIHINGSSHDPEALATLVQRRIDESMNWRTHDTSSEYT